MLFSCKHVRHIEIDERKFSELGRKMKIELILKINDKSSQLVCNLEYKKVFTLKDLAKSNETCYEHVYPKQILNSADELVAVICSNCAVCITHKKNSNEFNHQQSSFCVESRTGLKTPSVWDLHMISYVWNYCNIIEIECNSRYIALLVFILMTKGSQSDAISPQK